MILMPAARRRARSRIAATLIALPLLLAGCDGWLVPEPTPVAWDVVPTADGSATPGASPTPPTPSVTPTITLSPVASATPPIGAMPTLSAAMLTATAGGPLELDVPVIEYFVAFPTEARVGDIVLLFWRVSNVSEAAIWRVRADGTPGRTWAVGAEGELSVDAQAAGRVEEFVLAVSNGHTTIEQRVSVEVTCDQTWFFNEDVEEGCPESGPQITGAVRQGFERGQMIWLQASNQIVVLHTDSARPAWQSIGNTFAEGMPEEDPAFVPPEGMRQPRREFGVVWRDTPGVRDRLSWALGDPQPFTATYQRVRYDGGDLGLFFTDPAGAVISLLPDGEAWQIIAYVGTP
jgi:hypothetical protein